jgi:hypothetical protein
MRKDRHLLAIVMLLVLILVVLALSGCGQEEGTKAREAVDEAGQDALDFADGFCGTIILAPLAIGLAFTHRRKGGPR